MSAAPKWDDLARRLASAAALALVGLSAVTAGGGALTLLAGIAVGLMIWELARLCDATGPRAAVWAGGLAVISLWLVIVQHAPLWLVLLALPPLVGSVLVRRDRAIFAVYAGAVMATGYGIVAFRDGIGLGFVGWVLAVVVISDVLGYFAGRLIGGPKFWPRVSPKKTWSGTAAGWAGAALVGLGFVLWAGAPGWLVVLSPLLALAAQLGDIGESAIKRRAGVKDASALLPGHGGLLDRFDGLIGAVVFLLLWAHLMPLPLFG